MKTLEELLGAELHNQVKEKLGSFKVLVQEKDGDFIPRERLNEVTSKNQELQTELTNKTKELEKAQKAMEKNQKSVEEQLAELQKENQLLKDKDVAREKELVNISKRNALRTALTEAKVKPEYIGLIEKEFNLDDLEIENGSIKGITDKIKPLQEKMKDLFGQVKMSGEPPKKPDFKDDTNEVYTMEELQSMPVEVAQKNLDKVNKSLAFHNSK